MLSHGVRKNKLNLQAVHAGSNVRRKNLALDKSGKDWTMLKTLARRAVLALVLVLA